MASYQMRKYFKNVKTAWGHSLVSSFHGSNELLALAPTKDGQKDTKIWFDWKFDFLIFIIIFCTGLKVKKKKELKAKLVYLNSNWQCTKSNIFQKSSKNRWNSISIKSKQEIKSSNKHFTFLYSDEAQAILFLCWQDRISSKGKLKKEIDNGNNLNVNKS